MATKSKIIIKGKNKTQRKWKTHSLQIPCAITVSTRDLTLEEMAFLIDAEQKGKLPTITWIISSDGPADEKIKQLLQYLHSEEAKALGCNIQKHYDYAWIKFVLTYCKTPSAFFCLGVLSTPKFVSYVKSLGFHDIAGSKTLNKELATAFWDSKNNRITFPNSFVDKEECERRNRIALKFLEMLCEI